MVAFELAVACAMCERSGCSLADCLDVVGENHRISRLLHDSRRSAFAVPRATAALLGALPLVTIGLGELLGARRCRYCSAPRRAMRAWRWAAQATRWDCCGCHR